jgi:hypothetical protein
MPTDPLLQAAGNLSINTFTGNGITTSWNINFSGGYLDTSSVKAYTKSPVGVVTTVALTWVGPNTVDITPAVPSGHILTIYRDTPKSGPVVDFNDGAIINETNLDKLAKQSVFVSAEVMDRFTIVSDSAELALLKSEQAITLAAATIGADFTAFGRTNLSNTWTVAQSFPVGTSISGVLIATQSYVTTSIATGLATASADATTKANAAVSALRSEIDADWLYTLATR